MITAVVIKNSLSSAIIREKINQQKIILQTIYFSKILFEIVSK